MKLLAGIGSLGWGQRNRVDWSSWPLLWTALYHRRGIQAILELSEFANLVCGMWTWPWTTLPILATHAWTLCPVADILQFQSHGNEEDVSFSMGRHLYTEQHACRIEKHNLNQGRHQPFGTFSCSKRNVDRFCTHAVNATRQTTHPKKNYVMYPIPIYLNTINVEPCPVISLVTLWWNNAATWSPEAKPTSEFCPSAIDFQLFQMSTYKAFYLVIACWLE